MNKKITLFNQVSGPLFIDIANAFLEKYDEVILITGDIEQTYAQLDDKIKVIRKIKYKRNKAYLRIGTWLIFYLQCYFYLLFNKDHGKVLYVTNPPILPFLGVFFGKKALNFSVLIYDIYPDALLNFGYVKPNSFLYTFWQKMNKKSYELASEVITISSVMKKVIASNVDEYKIKVIYPWVDTNFIKPLNKSENWFVKQHGLTDKKVILYSGNMGFTHDLMTLMETAKELKKTENSFHFLLIGDGTQKESLQDFKEKHNLTNVSFLPYQDPEVLPFSFASADFGVVSLGSGAEGLSIPSKTFYLLSTGAAIIAITESGSEIDILVNENNCGISIQPKDKNKLIKFLLNSKENDIDLYKFNSRVLSNKFTKENAKKFL
tara:strand:+ start:3898 stop:5028 length:1131 start_codon:yes stop_codon:yes gene_type:complete